MLDGRSPGRALYAPLSGEEVFELAVGLPVGITATLEPTAYVRPLVAAFDEGRPAGVMVAGGAAVQLFEWRMGGVEEVGECAVAGARPGRVRTAVAAAGIAREVETIAGERGWTRVLCRRRLGAGARAGAWLRRGGPRAGDGDAPFDGLPPRIAAVVSGDLHEAQRRYGSGWPSGSSPPRSAAAPPSSASAAPWRRSTVPSRHLLFDGERDYRWSGALAGCRGPAALDPAEALIELALHWGADITPLEGRSRSLLTESDGVAAVLRA